MDTAAYRTATVGVHLRSRDDQRTHDACHTAAGLWNQAVLWARAKWAAGRKPDKHDIPHRDFDHQVTRKAAAFAIGHHAGQVVAGDVRGIEPNPEKTRRAGRSTRQWLSQWGRGRQEDCLAQMTGVPVERSDESYSSKTCPACFTRNRPWGRREASSDVQRRQARARSHAQNRAAADPIVSCVAEGRPVSSVTATSAADPMVAAA